MTEFLDHPGYPGQCCDTSPCTCQPAGQPLDQLVRTLDLIQDEHDHQPQFFKANHDMHAPRLLEIAQALRAELAKSQAATETNREVARVLLDELAALRPAAP